MITDLKILDNFYTNPDQVVSMITKDYPVTGCGGGIRTIDLREINEELYNNFCQAIFAVHGVTGENLYVTTFFTEHHYHEEEVFNERLIHIDGKDQDSCMLYNDRYDLLFCGQIFLAPNPDLESGMRVASVKKELNWTRNELIDNCINYYTDKLDGYREGKVTLKEYEEWHKQYHSNFEITATVGNVYNRMVSWRGGTLHGNIVTKKQGATFNQYFFVAVK